MKTLATARAAVIVAALLVIGAAAPAEPQSYKIDAEGFIQHWLVLEPIPVGVPQLTESGIQAIVKRPSFAELLTTLPKDGDRVTIDGAAYQWHAIHAAPDYLVSLSHFAAALNKPTGNVVFWGVAWLDCPQEMNDVRLAIGSNDSSVWWVNGKEVIGGYGDRQTQIDDNVSKRLTLSKGINVIRFAVINGGAGSDCCARFFDRNVKPITPPGISLEPPHSSAATAPVR